MSKSICHKSISVGRCCHMSIAQPSPNSSKSFSFELGKVLASVFTFSSPFVLKKKISELTRSFFQMRWTCFRTSLSELNVLCNFYSELEIYKIVVKCRVVNRLGTRSKNDPPVESNSPITVKILNVICAARQQVRMYLNLSKYSR